MADDSKRKFPKAKRGPHENDECQDKVCSDTTETFKAWMSNKYKNLKEAECPLDKESLGRHTWSLLHTMAATYPVRPTAEERKNMGEFIRLMSILYPCSYCAKDFRKDISEEPPMLESRDALTLWFCKMHNRVNVKLNKPEFDCSKVDERWRIGWKDGSCI